MTFRLSGHITFQQNARGVAFKIIVLTMAQRPQAGRKPCSAKADRDRYQDNQDVHRRTAFRTTKMEEVDITTAAISGVA